MGFETFSILLAGLFLWFLPGLAVSLWAPDRWFPQEEDRVVLAPFLGIALLLACLQISHVWWPVDGFAPWLFAGLVVVVLVGVWYKGIQQLRHFPGWLAGLMLLAVLISAFPVFKIGYPTTLGLDNDDAIYYVADAARFRDHVGVSIPDPISQGPWTGTIVQMTIHHLRVGADHYLAFFSSLLDSDPYRLHYLLFAGVVGLHVLGLYYLLRRSFDMPVRMIQVILGLYALSPILVSLMARSHSAQLLGMALMFPLIGAAVELVRRPGVQMAVTAGIIASGLLASYYEAAPFVVVILGFFLVLTWKDWSVRMVPYAIGALALAVALNPPATRDLVLGLVEEAGLGGRGGYSGFLPTGHQVGTLLGFVTLKPQDVALLNVVAPLLVVFGAIALLGIWHWVRERLWLPTAVALAAPVFIIYFRWLHPFPYAYWKSLTMLHFGLVVALGSGFYMIMDRLASRKYHMVGMGLLAIYLAAAGHTDFRLVQQASQSPLVVSQDVAALGSLPIPAGAMVELRGMDVPGSLIYYEHWAAYFLRNRPVSIPVLNKRSLLAVGRPNTYLYRPGSEYVLTRADIVKDPAAMWENGVYSLRPAEPNSLQLSVVPESWHGLELWAGTPTRWMAKQGSFAVKNVMPGRYVLRFRAKPRGGKTISLSLGEAVIAGPVRMQDSRDYMLGPFDLPAGASKLTLSVAETPARGGSGDPRLLSASVQGVRLEPAPPSDILDDPQAVVAGDTMLVPANSPDLRVTLMPDNWHGMELWGGTPTRWMGASGEIAVASHSARQVVLQFWAQPHGGPKTVSVSLNGQLEGSVRVDNPGVYRVGPFSVPAGNSAITLSSLEPPRPASVKDERLITVAVQHLLLAPK